MFGALTSLTGGGGMSASSSAAQTASNDISTGAISVGGLTMGQPSNNQTPLYVGGAVVLGLGLMWMMSKKRK